MSLSGHRRSVWEGPHVTETVEASSGAGTSAPGTDAAATPATRRRKAGGGPGGMLLPELKRPAGPLGIKGTGALRKGQLIEAIKAAQSGGSAGGGRAKASQPTLDSAVDAVAEAPAAKAAETPAKRDGGSRRTRAAAKTVEAPKDDAAPNGAARETAPAATAAVEAPAAPQHDTQPGTATQNGYAERVETRADERAERADRADRADR